jgi:hypothetical protein
MPPTRALSLATLAVSALGAATAACTTDGPIAGGRPPPADTALALRRVVSFTPGAVATLYGRNLSRLSTLEVGDTHVQVVRTSDSTATFTVPTWRACETDGRRVPLRANGSVQLSAPLELRDTVALAAGESRVVTGAEAACLRLGANDQDYVLSAVNPSRDAVQRSDRLLVLRTWTDGEPPPLPAAATAARPSRRPGGAPRVLPRTALTAADPYSPDPAGFDPRYATAAPGDTVTLVDWPALARLGGYPHPCQVPRERVPTYPARVAAVSGRVVIAVDLRARSRDDHFAPASLALLAKAARLADASLVETVRAVFDPDFEPLRGAGGRYYVVLSDDLAGAVGASSDGGTAQPRSVCALASEMPTTLASATVLTTDLMARNLARIAIHEYAHTADVVTAARRLGWRYAHSSGWMGEAWAVAAEETAVRIASGQPTGARLSRVTDDHPFSTLGLATLWGARPDLSPWTGPGQYEQGASLLMYARERAGEATLGSGRDRLYLRLLARGSWSLDALAAELGTTPEDLLDAWALAVATDDLVSAESAGASRLPQLVTWDNREPPMDARDATYRHPSRRLSRAAGTMRALEAAPGSVAAVYLMADGGRGVSLQAAGIDAARVRLTRLR